MGMMFFFILFNYNILRALKDGFVVPNIGAESISFIKMYIVTPVALGFMLYYTHMYNSIAFDKIFYRMGLSFLAFFILFACAYPLIDILHPNAQLIQKLINSKLVIGSFSLKFNHLNGSL